MSTLRPRVIPCLQLRNRSLVKTRRFRDPVYLGDPVNAVKIFNDKEADELIVLDITATAEGRAPNFEFIAEFASECFMPLAYGGGITSPEHVARLFAIGIEKAVINTAAFDSDLVTRAARDFGSQSIVVSMDVKKGLLGGHEVGTDRPVADGPLDLRQTVDDFRRAGPDATRALEGSLRRGEVLARKTVQSLRNGCRKCGAGRLRLHAGQSCASDRRVAVELEHPAVGSLRLGGLPAALERLGIRQPAPHFDDAARTLETALRERIGRLNQQRQLELPAGLRLVTGIEGCGAGGERVLEARGRELGDGLQVCVGRGAA